MSKEQFDKWFTDNYNYFVDKFSKQYKQSKSQISEDLSNFYIHVIEKDKLSVINNFDNYLASYIYYTHYQFFAGNKAQREGYITNNKKLSIKITNDLSSYNIPDNNLSLEDKLEEDKYIESKYKELTYIINTLPLDDRILYDLRYNKNLKILEIANQFGLQKPWISKKLKRLKEKIKSKMEYNV